MGDGNTVRIAMYFLTGLLCASLAFAEGGVRERDGGWGERVVSIERGEIIMQAPVPDAFAEHVMAQLPDDDRGQWYITIFAVPNSGDSALLLRDLQQAPALKALAAWGTINIVDYSTDAERARWKEAGIRHTPTVLVYPRPNHPKLPFRYALAQEGYGGDADRLARNIYSAVRKVYTKYNVEGPCPGPWCPNPQPNPQPNPSPTPYSPNAPNDWPPLMPVPEVPDAGLDLDLGLGGLVQFVVKAGIILIAIFVGLAVIPPLLKVGIVYTRKQLRDIASAVSDSGSGKSGGGSDTAAK